MDLKNAINVSALECDLEKDISRPIKKLTKLFENIRKEELSRYINRFSEGESELIEKISENFMKKLLASLKSKFETACNRGEAETFIKVLNDLFNLEEKNIEILASYK